MQDHLRTKFNWLYQFWLFTSKWKMISKLGNHLPIWIKAIYFQCCTSKNFPPKTFIIFILHFWTSKLSVGISQVTNARMSIVKRMQLKTLCAGYITYLIKTWTSLFYKEWIYNELYWSGGQLIKKCQSKVVYSTLK